MLAKVLTAWELSAGHHEPEPPASPQAVDEAEQALGRRLPEELRAFYATYGGGEFLEGNLGIHRPLGDGPDDDQSLVGASRMLREWDWPIPDELVVFGGNGAGDHFGLWLPADRGARPVVVQVGEVFEEPGLAVVGDDLGCFLAGWSAYYLLQDDEAAALDALGVPDDLRAHVGKDSDERATALLRWASPGLPGEPDPYAHGLTPQEVAAIAGRAT